MDQNSDYDGAWKKALSVYLQPFLKLCFPRVAREIDWRFPPVPLDKELHKIARDAALGQQTVDHLVKVRRRDGAEKWVLVHVEVQAQLDRSLPKRIYQYHHRLVDRYGHGVASLVVLADRNPNWRPFVYAEELLWGCQVRFKYPVSKLLDFDPVRLNKGRNPAAMVIAAHLAAAATRGKMERRKALRWAISRRLHGAGFNPEDIRLLLEMIDAMMVLPEPLNKALHQDLIQLEEEQRVRYVTSHERIGIQKGLEQGIEKGLEQGRQEGRQEGAAALAVRLARKRFAALGQDEEAAIRDLPLDLVEELSEALLDFTVLDDLVRWLAAARLSMAKPG